MDQLPPLPLAPCAGFRSAWGQRRHLTVPAPCPAKSGREGVAIDSL
jgi:hypothetical protein